MLEGRAEDSGGWKSRQTLVQKDGSLQGVKESGHKSKGGPGTQPAEEHLPVFCGTA